MRIARRGRTGWDAFAAAIGAPFVADLRAKSAEQILNGGWQAHGTVVDGWVLPESIYTTFAKGQQNDVPLLTGWTANDTGRATSLNASEFIRQTQATRGADADAFLKIYPASSDQEARQSQVAVVTDRMFGWNAWTWARMQSRTGTVSLVSLLLQLMSRHILTRPIRAPSMARTFITHSEISRTSRGRGDRRTELSRTR